MMLCSYIAVVVTCQAGDIKGLKINVQICFGNSVFLCSAVRSCGKAACFVMSFAFNSSLVCHC